MRMRDSLGNCRRWWAPTPAAVVFVFLLVISSSSSDVADGVRTTTRASGPGDDAGVLDDAEAVPAAGAGALHASSRATYKKTADRTEEDEGSLVVEEDRQWWLKEEREATGSRLPDCGHACGPCSPCRRVIVSFRCALGASESCPIAYRCMCRGRFFRVPSL